MSDSTKKTTQRKRPSIAPSSDSILESLRDLGGDATSTLKNEASEISKSFFDQMLGYYKPQAKASGEIMPGQSLVINKALEAEKTENKVLRQQLAHEQSLRAQEQQLATTRSQELKMQMTALTHELGQLASSTQNLAKETKIAVIQAPVDPGTYHITFFEQLRTHIVSFRRKIENASLWLQASNTRSAKKRGFWGQVGKSGAKRLLSAEDYLQRSAG